MCTSVCATRRRTGSWARRMGCRRSAGRRMGGQRISGVDQEGRRRRRTCMRNVYQRLSWIGAVQAMRVIVASLSLLFSSSDNSAAHTRSRMTTPQAESDKASAGSAPPAVAQDATSSESLDATPTTSWAHHYTALTSRLPTPIASRLPTASSVSASSSQLSSQLSSTSARLGEVATSTSARLSDLGRQGTVKLKESKALQKLDPDGFLTNAYSVTNSLSSPILSSLRGVMSTETVECLETCD